MHTLAHGARKDGDGSLISRSKRFKRVCFFFNDNFLFCFQTCFGEEINWYSIHKPQDFSFTAMIFDLDIAEGSVWAAQTLHFISTDLHLSFSDYEGSYLFFFS